LVTELPSVTIIHASTANKFWTMIRWEIHFIGKNLCFCSSHDALPACAAIFLLVKCLIEHGGGCRCSKHQICNT
jgi:hypothetical protein